MIGAYTIIFFFVCPETTYIRPAHFDTDIQEEKLQDSDTPASITSSDRPDGTESKVFREPSVAEQGTTPRSENLEAANGTSEQKTPYLQTLKVYNGRFSNEHVYKALITPWTAFLLPAVSWAAFSYGCSVAFAASFSVALGQIFSQPPYSLSTTTIGRSVFASFIGATLGNLIPGPVSDWLVKYLSRKNGGVYEPEFRLVLSVPALIFGLIAYWGFGWSLEVGSPFLLPVFFYGLAIFAGAINSLISNAYLLDCHRAQAQDGYAAVTIGRGVYSFAMTFVINGWIARDGYKVVYFWIGALHGLSCVIGIFLYFFGKKVCSNYSSWFFHLPMLMHLSRSDLLSTNLHSISEFWLSGLVLRRIEGKSHRMVRMYTLTATRLLARNGFN